MMFYYNGTKMQRHKINTQQFVGMSLFITVQ